MDPTDLLIFARDRRPIFLIWNENAYAPDWPATSANSLGAQAVGERVGGAVAISSFCSSFSILI